MASDPSNFPAEFDPGVAPPPEREWFADRERRNPLFRIAMRIVTPILSSFAFHMLVFGVLALKTWEFATRPLTHADFEAGIAYTGDITGGFKWPGENELQITPLDAPPVIEPARFTDNSNPRDVLKGAASDDSSRDSGGFGVGDIGRSGVLGIGSGAGTGGGAGGFGSGFGGGQNIGKANVWNLNAAGNHFAYVVDFSGSITVAADDLKRELKRSIGALRPTQTFNVIIFFSSTDDAKEKFISESFETQLVKAEPENKRRFFNWIDRKAPKGSTEPLASLKRALSLKPDAVFFFSDGLFDEKVVDEVVSSNKERKTHIHSLVFDEIILSDKSGLPVMTDGARRMQRLAEKNGGKTKIVSGTDLGNK